MSRGVSGTVVVSITCVKCEKQYSGKVSVNFVDSAMDKSICPPCGGKLWKPSTAGKKGKKKIKQPKN